MTINFPANRFFQQPAQPFEEPKKLTESDALAILVTHWDDINGRDDITSDKDLNKILANPDTPDDLVAAAQFFQDNPAAFNRLDTAAKGGKTDGKVSTQDLVHRSAEFISEEDALHALIGDFDKLNGRDSIVSEKDLGNVNGYPIDVRIAAQYYRVHPEEFDKLDAAKNGELDNKVSIDDVRLRLDDVRQSAEPFQQVSSHNSYERPDTITEQHREHGVHSFELDIRDTAAKGGTEPKDGDWDVRHDAGDTSTGTLTEYLTEIGELDTNEPISLFIDLKGSPLQSEGHSPAELDRLLEAQYGDRLFTPADLMARVPEAETLQEAIELGGWPSEEELEGKIVVSITGGEDGLDNYFGAERSNDVEMSAFIAPEPKIEDGEFVPQDNAVIYNLNAKPYVRGLDYRDATANINQLVTESGNLIRNYRVDESNFDQLAASGATFLATDYYDKVS